MRFDRVASHTRSGYESLMGIDRPWILIAAMCLVMVAVAAALLGAVPDLRRPVQDFLGYGGPHTDESTGSRYLFHTGADIRGEKKGETYSAYVTRRESLETTEGFMGFPCVATCKELEAGYRWAEAKGVTDARSCRGPSWPFVEGCVAYVARAARPQ